jgi:hypothetical protein
VNWWVEFLSDVVVDLAVPKTAFVVLIVWLMLR